MIIIRSPLRLSIGGGGTDIPSFYKKKEGFCISLAINKYVYIALNERHNNNFLLKYSRTEKCKKIQDIKHPIIKETLKYFNIKKKNLEIASFADVPAGTGLGSSSSFTCALVKAIATFKKINLSKKDLAEIACKIEIENLKQPIGKQDQFISSYGGLQSFFFKKDDKVVVKKIKLNEKEVKKFSNKLILSFTGITRKTNSILKDQNKKTLISNSKMIENLIETKNIGKNIKNILVNKKFNNYGSILNHHWINKKKRSNKITSKKIDKIYNSGIKYYAKGGKLVGAGGGGFILFYSNNVKKLNEYFKRKKIKCLKFLPDFEGTKIIHSD